MANKAGKMYDKSPKLERNEDGDMKVKKADEPKAEGKEKTVGEDGSSAEDDGEVKNKPKNVHEEERASMHRRHEEEQKAMHERHSKDMKDMHKRHEKADMQGKEHAEEKTGGEEINKIKDTE